MIQIKDGVTRGCPGARSFAPTAPSPCYAALWSVMRARVPPTGGRQGAERLLLEVGVKPVTTRFSVIARTPLTVGVTGHPTARMLRERAGWLAQESTSAASRVGSRVLSSRRSETGRGLCYATQVFAPSSCRSSRRLMRRQSLPRQQVGSPSLRGAGREVRSHVLSRSHCPQVAPRPRAA
jgi:hypothetical protein